MTRETDITIIKKRKSNRTYLNQKLTVDEMEQINSILKQNYIGPYGNTAKFQLIEKKTAKAMHKVKLGTYGFISGAKYFIIGQIKNSTYANEDYGYIFEKIILEMTRLNLGTCWLGGTFSREEIGLVLDMDQDAIIPAITPVGHCTDTFSKRESLIRWGAKSDSRKDWSEIFFVDSFEQSLTKDDAEDYAIALEMLRIAPSASNKQPWRILKKDSAFHFYLKRTAGYQKSIKTTDLQKTDLGIAMAHFELACTELKLKGKWVNENPSIESDKVDDYCLTWVF